MKTLNTISATEDGRDLDAASKMYFELLDRMVEQDISDFRNGRIDQSRLNWTIESIKSVMSSTNNELALSKLQELYDRAVKCAELE